MGFQDALHMLRIPYASAEAVDFADRAMEAVAYYAYWASTDLAEERGRYSSFNGSLWSQGILPQDSLKMLAEERGGYLEADFSETLDWNALRSRIMTRRHAQLQLPGHRPHRDHRQHRRRVSQHRAAPTRTCSSNPTCPASSPWSTSTWCATSRP